MTKISDLPAAQQVRHGSLRDPRYLFWHIAQWPRHRYELAKAKRAARQ